MVYVLTITDKTGFTWVQGVFSTLEKAETEFEAMIQTEMYADAGLKRTIGCFEVI